ncbi:hypothetical protein [Cupriavidus sp. H39]|uniref:hypothetical protein n=1 Tax=Cupriavidus sp. H39 TaxID=3401635 RepID=UPI003D093155
MTRICSLFVTVVAVLATAGTAHAQHIVGGMGEAVRIGAFSEPGQASRNRGFAADSRAAKAGQERTRAAASQQPRRGDARASAGLLPGRHLP